MSLVIKLRAKLAGNVDFAGRGMGNFQFSGLRGRCDRQTPYRGPTIDSEGFDATIIKMKIRFGGDLTQEYG